jgi:hypothetical protein
MKTLVERLLVTSGLSGAILCGLLTAGCQTMKDEANAEPAAASVTTPAHPVHPAARKVVAAPKAVPPVSLGSNPNCEWPVIAKSPAAVADPCMTTGKFIDTIASLNARQKTMARRLVAASDRLMAKIGARLAH